MSKTILRTQQIVIDVPTNLSAPFIHLYLQKVVRDDSERDLQVIDRYHQVHRKLTDVALECANIQDPVTGEKFNISIAGIDRAIRAVTLKWMQESFGGTLRGDELDITDINQGV
jgi:hypothetical protein